MKAFIQDRERVLDSTNDLLKTSVYADNLVKVIENTPRDKVFTIGVFGGWGTGKSSIIRTAQESIEKKNKDVKFITYDAWKYANDSFRRMFLLKIQQELKMRQTAEMHRFYQSETAEAEPKTTLSAKGIALAVIVVAVVSMILFLIPSVSIEWKVAIPTIGTLGTFLIALINGCFYDLKISYSKPALFAPEQFEACFKEMMSKCLKANKWFKKTCSTIKDYVEVCEKSVVSLDKLVIIIDNIDRCPSDMAYQLLTDIKTFLSNADYNLVFIVPVDDEALKKHLFRRWDKQNVEDVNKEKEEFLRKFFNVALRIKPHQETELHHFAHEINRENNLGYSNETLAIVAKEFADNPRRIIQLLNNLSGDLSLYEDDFVAKNETAICAALIIQEEYPDFYKRATRDLNLVKGFDETTDKDENLKGFMRVAGYSLKQKPLDVLQRIFTNTSSIFSDLPTDVQKAVQSYDSSKVIEFAKANEDKKTNLVDFVIESLKTDVKYGATSQTTLWLELLCLLYQAAVFDASRFSAIDNVLSPFYTTAIPAIANASSLCFMGRQMNNSGISSLRSSIVEYLTEENLAEESKDNFDNVLTAFYYNFTSEQDCIDIAAKVEKYYADNIIDKNINYSDTQKRILFSDSFVVKQVANMQSIDDEMRIGNIIWCIQNNPNLSSETFTAIFGKCIGLFGEVRGKSKDAFLGLINKLKPIFVAIDISRLDNEPSQLYHLIVDTRGIPNPSYRNLPQYDVKRSIFDEIDTEEAKSMTGFCYEVMRISGGSVDVSEAINKLISKCKETVVEGALRIHSLGISIEPLSSTLITIDDYESGNDLSLLEIVLSRQPDGSFKPDEETVRSKIHQLVDNANNTNVESLIIKLISDKQLLAMVAEYAASLDSERINTLPLSIAKYAVSTFTRVNAETYKDNPDFLILVLKNGNAVQKKEVIRLMKVKINQETDLENVVKVLNNLTTEDQQILNSVVSELKVLKDSESVSDDIKPLIEELINKLSKSIKKKKIIYKMLGRNKNS